MTDALLTTVAGDRLSVRSESERIVEMRIVPWDVVGQTAEGPESFARGAFRGTNPADVTIEAIGPHGMAPGVRLVGRGESLDERDDGAYLAARISRTVAGDELLELVRDGVYRKASIVFAPIRSRSVAGVAERQLVDLRRVGIVERGAYPSAEVLAVRSQEGAPTMTEPRDPTPTPEPPEPEPEPTPGARIIRTTENADALDALRRDMLGRMTALEARGVARVASPMARWATLGEYLHDASGDPAAAVLLARVLADQTTAQNPGVTPPSYLSEVFGNITAVRGAVTGFGGPKSLGTSGMAIHWPYYAGDLTALVGKQAAQKTEITSVRVDILDGQGPIETFAGGSDISYQLIRRSEPSYIEAYGRIMLAGWSLVTEKEFETDLLGGATGTFVFDPTAPLTDAEIRAAFFAASAKVKAATGSPASIVLASSDVFGTLGGQLTPPAYGTQNLTGTAQASTLRINVSGLEVVEAPFLPASTILFGNATAAGWHEDGPMVATAEDVARLGQNRAIWSMGATAIYIPAGLVKNTLIAGTTAARASK